MKTKQSLQRIPYNWLQTLLSSLLFFRFLSEFHDPNKVLRLAKTVKVFVFITIVSTPSLLASFASSQIYKARQASKHTTSRICLPRGKMFLFWVKNISACRRAISACLTRNVWKIWRWWKKQARIHCLNYPMFRQCWSVDRQAFRPNLHNAGTIWQLSQTMATCVYTIPIRKGYGAIMKWKQNSNRHQSKMEQ